jgi:hypothetical protein
MYQPCLSHSSSSKFHTFLRSYRQVYILLDSVHKVGAPKSLVLSPFSFPFRRNAPRITYIPTRELVIELVWGIRTETSVAVTLLDGHSKEAQVKGASDKDWVILSMRLFASLSLQELSRERGKEEKN